eukprot:SAG25_NODE_380_length_8808_cov_3.861523_5_plen_60_part_00
MECIRRSENEHIVACQWATTSSSKPPDPGGYVRCGEVRTFFHTQHTAHSACTAAVRGET